MELTVTTDQECLTAFGMSAWYTLWYSGCTKSINTYFDLYIEYTPLYEDDTKKVNEIGELIKPQGVGTIFI